MAIHEVRFVHAAIDAPPERVYAFAADPENLPRWAPNFGSAISRSGDGWIIQTPEGPLRVRFAQANGLGVLDHWVHLPDGTVLYNAMRVTANGGGSVISFTLARQDGWSDERFDEDAGLVSADLVRLKDLLESAEAN